MRKYLQLLYTNNVLSMILIAMILGILFVKVNMSATFSHIDSWANYPLAYIIENNLDWVTNAQYPGMGQRLYYYLLVVIKVITGIDYYYLTKYLFLLIDGLMLVFLSIFLRKINSASRILVLLSLLLIVINPYVFRRLLVSLRENYALILFLGYLYLFFRHTFDKRILSSLLGGAIFLTHPITSIVYILFNGCIGLYLLVKRQWKDLKSFSLILIGSIIVGINGFIGYIDSLIWQYYNALPKVVSKNTNDFFYFIINFTKVDYIYTTFLLIASILFGYTVAKGLLQKNGLTARRCGLASLLVVFTTLYILGFIPATGFYQDRLTLYLGIFGILFISEFFDRIQLQRQKGLLLILVSYSLITTINLVNFGIWLPFEHTNFSDPAYNHIKSANQIIISGFDRNVIYQVNPMSKIDENLVETFFAIENDTELNAFLEKNRFVLFLSPYTLNNSLKTNFTVNYLKKNNQLVRLTDGNYIFSNQQ